MSITTSNARPQRFFGRADRPLDPGRRYLRASFAREMAKDAFGQRSADVLDQDDFNDRLPGPMLLFPTKARAR